MDKQATTHRPLPPTLVGCPWCETPVELDPDAWSIACPSCHVVVELAPAARRRAPRSTHRLAA